MAIALPKLGSSFFENRSLAGNFSSAVAGFAGGIGIGTVTTGAGSGAGGAATTGGVGSGGGVVTTGAGGSMTAGAGVAGCGAGAGAAGTGAGGSLATGGTGACAMLVRSVTAKAPTRKTSDRPNTAIKRVLMRLPI